MKQTPMPPRSRPLARTVPLQARTPLSRDTGLQRAGRINPVSSKRRAENQERRAMLTGLYGSEQPPCAVWVLLHPEWCTRWADDAHEPLSRARLGSITDPANVIAICRPCHDVLTFRPESEIPWAYRLGLIRHSGLCCQGRKVCARYAEDGEAA
jgi:hypothetical protein